MRRLERLFAHPDTLIGAVLLAFCALAWWLTTGFDEVPAMLSQNVPPTFFPRLVIATAALLSVGLVITGLRRPFRDDARTDARRRDSPPTGSSPSLRSALPPPVFWATIGVITAAGVSIPILGTLPTLGLLAAVLPVLWDERRYHLVASLALGLPAAVYAVFTLGLGVRFPAGWMWNLLLSG